MTYDPDLAAKRLAEWAAFRDRYPEFWRQQQPPRPSPEAVRVVRALLRGERP